MGILNILGPDGHTELTWDTDKASIDEVRRRLQRTCCRSSGDE